MEMNNSFVEACVFSYWRQEEHLVVVVFLQNNVKNHCEPSSASGNWNASGRSQVILFVYTYLNTNHILSSFAADDMTLTGCEQVKSTVSLRSRKLTYRNKDKELPRGHH